MDGRNIRRTARLLRKRLISLWLRVSWKRKSTLRNLIFCVRLGLCLMFFVGFRSNQNEQKITWSHFSYFWNATSITVSNFRAPRPCSNIALCVLCFLHVMAYVVQFDVRCRQFGILSMREHWNLACWFWFMQHYQNVNNQLADTPYCEISSKLKSLKICPFTLNKLYTDFTLISSQVYWYHFENSSENSVLLDCSAL